MHIRIEYTGTIESIICGAGLYPDLEVAILMALFKASRFKSAANARASLLRLVLIWNRFDIAKQYLFSGDQEGGESASRTINQRRGS